MRHMPFRDAEGRQQQGGQQSADGSYRKNLYASTAVSILLAPLLHRVSSAVVRAWLPLAYRVRMRDSPHFELYDMCTLQYSTCHLFPTTSDVAFIDSSPTRK